MSEKALVQLTRSQFSDRKTTLRQRSFEVSVFDETIASLVRDLTDTMLAHRIAIGLAAPQIGVQMRVAVVNISPERAGATIVLINPVVVTTSGKKIVKRESCMSLPDYGGDVERREKIVVEFQDMTGAKQTLQASGFLARVIAHETDHLDGFLYVDRMKDSKSLVPVDIFKKDS